MSRSSPGSISGTLFPGRYLRDCLERDARPWTAPGDERLQRQAERWWASVVSECGPASGLRALFDVVAMPLFGMLGFRARDARFDRSCARVRLETRAGERVGLVVLPWAARPSSAWRQLAGVARDAGAAWCFLLAPPFLALVDARGHATRRSLEFTLPGVLSADVFTLFRTLTRAPMFDASTGRSPIDQLVSMADRYQERVREDLRTGVTEALGHLSAVVDGRSDAVRFDESLTIVYRILFLLFVESRDLVPRHDPIYEQAYTVGALCRDALSVPAQPGSWEALAAITRLSRRGCDTRDLIVAPFNGPLFARTSAPSLETPRVSGRHTKRRTERDRALGRSLVALGTRAGAAGREEISFQDLGVEQLGAVYEHVLDLDPARPTRGTTRQPPRSAHSDKRKQSGTFYTPRALAEFVVRRTLAPLVSGRSPDDILRLRVVDPAMGSGAFLVAACRYLAAAYERALIEDARREPADFDEDTRADIRRLIAEQCLAGVDVNPVAVQLARLSLWLTTLARGKPLGFLDDRLRVGNSLIGAAPDDLRRTVSGRGRSSASNLPLFDGDELEHAVKGAVRSLVDLRARRDDSVADVRAREALWNALVSVQSPLQPWRTAATLWCARWFWPRTSTAPAPPELRALLDAVLNGDTTLPRTRVNARVSDASALGDALGFFHWPLEFSDVFYEHDGRAKADAGFDAVIGNPPWEMLRRDEHETDTARDAASTAPPASLVRFIRESALYPACDRGHLNLYQPFVERAISLCRPGGQVGLIVPWGLAVDDGAAALRRTLLDRASISTLVGLDNSRALFPIHRGLRIMAFVASPGAATDRIRARFDVRTADELDALPDEESPLHPTSFPVRFDTSQLAVTGGAARRIAYVRRHEEFALLERLSRDFPTLGSEAGWGARFGRELNATDDRPLFGQSGLEVIEGKHIEPFIVQQRSQLRIARDVAMRRFPDARFDRPRLGYRDVSGAANRLSLIAAIIPADVVTTHTIFCLRTAASLDAQHLICGLMNSYVVNAIVRMLMGGHLTTSLVEGLPAPPPDGGTAQRTATRLARRLTRHPQSAGAAAELQAAVARLYGVEPPVFRKLLDGFPLVAPETREHAARALERTHRHRRRGAILQ